MTHVLVGYDKKTDLKAFEIRIPEQTLQELKKFIKPDPDDPEMVGSYEADYSFFIEPA